MKLAALLCYAKLCPLTRRRSPAQVNRSTEPPPVAGGWLGAGLTTPTIPLATPLLSFILLLLLAAAPATRAIAGPIVIDRVSEGPLPQIRPRLDSVEAGEPGFRLLVYVAPGYDLHFEQGDMICWNGTVKEDTYFIGSEWNGLQFSVTDEDIAHPGVFSVSVVRPSPSGGYETLGEAPFFVRPRRKAVADFDGDQKTDVSIWRPGDGTWHVLPSGGADLYQVPFGQTGDKPVPADYDGDGRADVAVFRPSNGTWRIVQSSNDVILEVELGNNTDVPVPADYDGDGRADVAVFRPSNGTWHILQSRDGYRTLQFGTDGDKPVPADYDGDGRADVAVFRPSNGTWHILQSADGEAVSKLGLSTDIPVPADYNGDSITDIAVFRPSNGTWYILDWDGTVHEQQLVSPQPGDTPVPGDYDGDGTADLALLREDEGVENGGRTWHILQSGDGSVLTKHFGDLGDVPVASAYLFDFDR